MSEVSNQVRILLQGNEGNYFSIQIFFYIVSDLPDRVKRRKIWKNVLQADDFIGYFEPINMYDTVDHELKIFSSALLLIDILQK